MARNAAMPSGYDYEFVKELHEDYMCVICHLAMRNPVLTNCGHQFCKECLDEAYKRGRQCPVDREPLTPEEIFPNKFTERKILSLEITCSDKGCDWQGELRNIESHESRCDYKVVDCDNKSCKVRKPRCEMVRHVQEECQYRMVSCPHCKNTYRFCLLEDHTSNCPKCPVSCPKDCGKTMKREEITSHLSDECPLTIIPCSYESIGCTFKEQREDLDEHIENHVKQHLNIAVEKIVSLQKQMGEMKKQTTLTNQHIQKQMGEMKKQTAPLHQIKDLQKQMDEMEKQSTLTNQYIQKQMDEMKKQTTLANQRIQEQMGEMKKQTAPLHQIKDLQKQMDEMKKQTANVMTKENQGCLSYIWEIKNLNQPRGTDYSAQQNYQQSVFSNLFYGVTVSSTPFYTHEYGYKLMLDLSNNVITLYVMRGEYDETLAWPFYVNKVSFFHAHHDQQAQQGKSVVGLYSGGRSCTGFQKPQEANVPIATCHLGMQSIPKAAFSGRQLNTQINTQIYIPNDTFMLKLEILFYRNHLSHRQLNSELVGRQTDRAIGSGFGMNPFNNCKGGH